VLLNTKKKSLGVLYMFKKIGNKISIFFTKKFPLWAKEN
jgi:hypothetical protein